MILLDCVDTDTRDGGFEYSDDEPEEQHMSSDSLPKPLIGFQMKTGGGILHASDTQPVQASFSHSRPTSMKGNAGG
ncbi:hypothetical protein C4D60_Mb03t19240 [Musa balbisiana]|uniref:Uncharacterized protein n=1 Tax=Musa balbisiana TaxID=52838 RepID=A0A4S8JB39_MUSBA|nr:hypothetical protein C4D60_Mb03t19240 [Musa balbisiana]